MSCLRRNARMVRQTPFTVFGDGRRSGQTRRFKSAADSRSVLKHTGCSSNPLQRVSHIRRRFQPVAQTMTDAPFSIGDALVPYLLTHR
jgi:hypothetical protein